MSDASQSSNPKIAQLERDIAALEQEVGGFEVAEKEVNAHHRALHDYNEAKVWH
ncbi:hypothetical protein DL93DRAFT_2167659 [Clavulina sp. PMI_390]|nr:hypothetical protein DL93DRAFT_2167659 [Clavulina sp. PMI_390]